MKKTLTLLIIVIVLGGAWSGGWYFVAGKVEEAISLVKTRLESQNKLFQCPNETISGFPFRISVTCDETSYFDNDKGFAMEAGALRSAAQAYQPGKAIVELDGPAVLTVANSQTFDASWNSLRASVSAGLSGVEEFSTIGKNLSLVPARQSQDSVTMSELQVHGRKFEQNDVDLAFSSENVVSEKRLWPEFNFAVNVRITNIYDQISRRPDLLKIARQQGLKGELTGLEYVSLEGGKVSATGPIEIDNQGLVTGKFNISVTESSSLIRSLAQAFPDQRKLFERAEAAAGILSAVTKDGQIKVPVTVSDGEARIGLIPVGRIPPIF